MTPTSFLRQAVGVAATLVIGAWGCGGDVTVPTFAEGVTDGELSKPASDVSGEGVSFADEQAAEASDEMVFPEVGDVSDVYADADVEPGACSGFVKPAGCKCKGNGDCMSGWCVLHLGELVCTEECVQECPDGYDCEAVGAGPDTVFICTSLYPALCLPCSTDKDCGADGIGGASSCVVYPSGKGSFCGKACAADGDCPGGFKCEEAVLTGGQKMKQCLISKDECPCTSYAFENGSSTSCTWGNEFGECEGTRVCGEGGLTECSAAEPKEEVCDGEDNDCDSGIDENVTCDDGNQCTKDSCKGEEGCMNKSLGIEDQASCYVGKCLEDPHCEAGECVGTSVDSDDDNPCTDDWCDPQEGVKHKFNSAACDDGDACTSQDWCEQGTCVGIATGCDDGDPCTTDACDQDSGECVSTMLEECESPVLLRGGFRAAYWTSVSNDGKSAFSIGAQAVGGGMAGDSAGVHFHVGLVPYLNK